ncbi:hypothetical protein [uncultured Corynebacterium sp.]|uniref:hypothetical protein n=1 Tax=uncultured Corynebacterium sp. TaxID=159447 RepID=UPI0028D55808|nr:hypothetical protein [uncultured Corynebacterium sp.]
MRNCVGRPRAGGRLRGRRKPSRLLSADAAVLVCGQFAGRHPRLRSGRNEPGAGPEYAHNLLAAWLQVLAVACGCRAQLPCLPQSASARTSRRPHPWACEGRGNWSCVGV